MTSELYPCPLCFNKDVAPIEGPDNRKYLYCGNCLLIYTDKGSLPTLEEEEKRYRAHNNGIEYTGYVNFLNKALQPALPWLSKGMSGLDYGCGPGPTLSVMLKQIGIACADYDPIFFPILPDGPFDFIFATECFEHFFNPAEEMRKITDLLKPGGVLVIMTLPWTTPGAFKTWWYARDNTHVCFYHNKTFDYIATTYNFKILSAGGYDVVILKID